MDQYAEGTEWTAVSTGLIPRLKNQLSGTDWVIATYHWEQDASTGGIGLPDLDGNAVIAALHALEHGPELAQLLRDAAPNLREVQFIAHSAGSWAAKVAMESLVAEDPSYVVTELTLLDPFVPNESGLTESAINAIAQNENAERFHRLENYYAADFTGPSTARIFNDWSCSGDINVRVDFGAFNSYYLDHSGPIQFYSDSVGSVGGNIPPYPLFGWNTSCGFNLYYSSIGYWLGLPFQDSQRPRITIQPQSVTTVASGFPLNLSVTALRATAWTWYKDETPQGNNPTLTISAVSAADAGTYVVKVSNDYGLVYSDTAVVNVTATPPPGLAAPTNLLASAASATQVNLSWSYASSGQGGFVIERSVGASSYAQLTTTSATSRAYSDYSCSPGTTYFYRVKAVNGSLVSQPSNTATATTPQQPGSNVILNITSTNPSSGVQVWTFYDGSNLINATTPTSRSFPSGTYASVFSVGTAPNGNIFQKWQVDGIDYPLPTVTVLMNGPHTVTAVYAGSPPANRTLSSLTVEGPSSVDELTSTQYSARANYTDGSSNYVNASWSEDSNYATISSNGLLNAGAVNSDRAIEVTAEYSEGGVTRSRIKDVTIRNTNSSGEYVLSVSAQHGYVFVSPNLGSYPAGTQVYLHAHADDGYVFDHWAGNASGSDPTIYLTMNGNKSVTANFAVNTSTGSLRTNISPAQAISEGAQWRYNFYTEWRDSGTTQDNIPVGSGYVHFRDIPGWVTPDDIPAAIVGGQTTVVNATYQEILGAVQVTITPPEAVAAGAHWRIDGGAWRDSGTTVSSVSPGNRTIEFQSIAAWQTPSSQTISVTRGNTNVLTASYGPPAGQPVISSISPNTGSITGGTSVAIAGINFQPGATVTFGGLAASSVTVVDSAHIAAVTPARASYGSVTVAVTVNGQTATVPNGFSYLIPLGSNMELIGQIGGVDGAVAVSGNYMYMGQGTSLAIFDVSNPTTPVERGRIALPSLVQNDIVVVGSRAYVADGRSGLYVVDVSTPTAPGIIGFYDTDGLATGLALDGTFAYVADGSGGLVILDVSNPSAITRAGSLGISPGNMDHIAVGTIGGDKYAFLGGYQANMNVIKVTNPQSPTFVTSIPILSFVGISDVKIVGAILYFGDPGDTSGNNAGTKIYNLSNPASPVLLGTAQNHGALDVTANRLYVWSGNLKVYDVTNPSAPVSLGNLFVGISHSNDRIAVSNNNAFITDIVSAADGIDGTKIISVANPSSMSVRSTIQGIGNAQGVFLKNSIAYIGGQSTGLSTIDITNPARPVRLGHLRVASTGQQDRVSSIAVDGATATLVNYGDDAIVVADVTNPITPVKSGTYTGSVGWEVALLGTNPVLAAQTTAPTPLPKIDVLDVSNPSSPHSVGSLTLQQTAGAAVSVAISSQWGFVGRDQQALDVINLASPTAPVRVGSLPTTDSFWDTAATADGNYVFLAKNDNSVNPGIAVVDATTKTAPMFVTTINPPQNPNAGLKAVTVSGSRLFAADSKFCYVYDISTPSSPQQVAYYNLPSIVGFNGSIDVAGDLAYIANANSGLTILRVRDITNPTVTITSPTTGSTFTTNSSTISLGGSASGVNGVTGVTWQSNRGGGGTAQGTTAWSVANIQLTSGQNVLTLTARDNNGNLGSRTLTVTCTLPDMTPPVVTITGPNTAAQYSVSTPTITMTGTAADESTISSVNWSNDRGGNGSAIGLTGWSIPNLQLFEGPNTITVTAHDAAGNIGTSSQFIIYASPDTEPPVVAIAFPTSNPIYSTTDSTLNISGTATDNRAITQIRWENDRGGSDWAEGTDIWFANGIPLQSGSNTLTVTATDTSGNTGVTTLTVVSGLPPLAIDSAVSRKTHGSAAVFDINLLSSGVECRTGGANGNHTIVVTFNNPIVSGNAVVTAGTGSIAGTPMFSGNTMTVNLTGVTDAQRVTLTFSNVTDSFSQTLPSTPLTFGFLLGDTTGNGTVNSSDVSLTKLKSGQVVDASNFRTDVSCNGSINSSDVSQVKLKSGSGLP